MKARLLKKLLNNTGYAISNHTDYIAVGSPMCHDLLSVNKKTLKVRYALDTFREGRRVIKNTQLEFIWDRLHELIESGQIRDIIDGKDEIENPLPVYTVVDGKLAESVTDEYGWPNTDDDGVCMYENTHFPDKDDAIEFGIREYEAAERFALDRIKEKEEDLRQVNILLNQYRSFITHLKSLQNH